MSFLLVVKISAHAGLVFLLHLHLLPLRRRRPIHLVRVLIFRWAHYYSCHLFKQHKFVTQSPPGICLLPLLSCFYVVSVSFPKVLLFMYQLVLMSALLLVHLLSPCSGSVEQLQCSSCQFFLIFFIFWVFICFVFVLAKRLSWQVRLSCTLGVVNSTVACISFYYCALQRMEL